MPHTNSARSFARARSLFGLVLVAGLAAIAPTFAPRTAEAAPAAASLSADTARFTDINGKAYVRTEGDNYYPVDGKGDAVDLEIISRVVAHGAGTTKATNRNGRTRNDDGVRRDASGVLLRSLIDTRPFDAQLMGFRPGQIIPTAAQAAEMFFGVNYRWKLDQALGGVRKDDNGESFNPADRQWAAWTKSYKSRDKGDLVSIDKWRKHIADTLKGTTKSTFDTPLPPGFSSTAYTNRKTFDEAPPAGWAELIAGAHKRSDRRQLAKGHSMTEGGRILDAAGKLVANIDGDEIKVRGKRLNGDERIAIISLFL